jgi:hypothetical protein
MELLWGKGLAPINMILPQVDSLCMHQPGVQMELPLGEELAQNNNVCQDANATGYTEILNL